MASYSNRIGFPRFSVGSGGRDNIEVKQFLWVIDNVVDESRKCSKGPGLGNTKYHSERLSFGKMNRTTG